MTRANQQVADDPVEKSERETVRDQRRADALRANLKRRKAQVRGRARQMGDEADDSRDAAKDQR